MKTLMWAYVVFNIKITFSIFGEFFCMNGKVIVKKYIIQRFRLYARVYLIFTTGGKPQKQPAILTPRVYVHMYTQNGLQNYYNRG